MIRKIYFVAFLVCMLCVSGCKKKNKSTSTVIAKDNLGTNAKITEYTNTLETQRHHHQCINAKFNIEVELEGKSYGGTGELRQAQDLMTFMVVKKFGIEIGRAWISKDSLLFINRWQRAYIHQSLAYFEEYYGAPAKLALLQELFTNVPALREDGQRKIFTEANQDIVLAGQSAYDQIQVDCVFDPVNHVLKAAEYVKSSDAYVQLFVDAVRQHDIFMNRLIEIRRKDDALGIKLNYKSIETGNCQVPKLEIPEGYERVNAL